MKESPREHFRWAAHTGGLAMVKARDYEVRGEADALTPYALWKRLSEENEGRDALAPGDILEAVTEDGAGRLLIVKYIGFEPAQWLVSEPSTNMTDACLPREAGELVHSESAKA